MKVNSDSSKVSKWSDIKRKIRKIFIWFVSLVVIIICVFIYWQYFYTYSDGYRAGVLQKFSHKGNIFKTYEGEMILSSETGNPEVTLASEKFNFSVTNHNLVNTFDTIQGQKVIVHYKQKNSSLFWHGDSEYLVDSVRLIR